MRKLELLVIAVLLCGVILACGKAEEPVPVKETEETEHTRAVTPEEVKKETMEAIEAAKTYTAQQKEEYEQKMAARLEELNGQIEELKVKAEEARPELEARLREEIEQLEQKSEAARKKLEELKSASEEAWSDLKEELDEKMQELEDFLKGALPTTE
ncbi:MAG: hypothetical protein Kow0099_27940 [Candidatus Abyssubacteria bacterium]